MNIRSEEFAVGAISESALTRPTLAEPAVEPKRHPMPPDHPRRILVADDESLVAASIMLCVRQLGYIAIGPARDGEHAIEMAFTKLPDMAILDVRMMSDSDGIDAARAMFMELLLPVVIVSAYSDRQQVASASEAGVFGYLVKPVTRAQLGPAIEICWARYNQYMAKEFEAEVLRRHLEDKQDIEHAKWVLVERDGVEETEAMRSMRRLARESGRALPDVARSILNR